MEDMMYNILWIDDEHEEFIPLKGQAKRNKIHLIGYKSLNAGMDELKRNYSFYDGVLLDAKILENEDDETGTEDIRFVHRAKEQLEQLSEKKKFEIFVLTGQAEAFGNKTFRDMYLKVYKKGDEKDIGKLFNDLKAAADSQFDTQLRHTYKRVFDVCTEDYIGAYAGQDLLSLLKVEDESNIDNHFNTIRKIIEDLFSAFNNFNLLPVEFVTPKVALNPSSIFLAGQSQNENTYEVYKQYKHLRETHLPSQIAYYLRTILHVTQSGSHRSHIDEHVRSVQTSYLLKSTLFQLMDVLVWFKMYADAKPKTNNWVKTDNETLIPKASNWENAKTNTDTYEPPITKENYTETIWLLGKIINISDNNEGVFQAIISLNKFPVSSDLIEKHNLKLNESVKVKIVPTEDGTERCVEDVSKDL